MERITGPARKALQERLEGQEPRASYHRCEFGRTDGADVYNVDGRWVQVTYWSEESDDMRSKRGSRMETLSPERAELFISEFSKN